MKITEINVIIDVNLDSAIALESTNLKLDRVA